MGWGGIRVGSFSLSSLVLACVCLGWGSFSGVETRVLCGIRGGSATSLSSFPLLVCVESSLAMDQPSFSSVMVVARTRYEQVVRMTMLGRLLYFLLGGPVGLVAHTN